MIVRLMPSSLLTALFVSSAFGVHAALLPEAALSQRVVPVQQEPRHRLLHESARMWVLDVQIQPGDTTLLHTHSTPISYVTISTSSTDQRSVDGSWNGTVPRDPPPGTIGSVRGVTSYREQPVTHQVTNVGQTMFRLIAIASRSRGISRSAANEAGSPALPGETQGQPNAWFAYSRVVLAPGEKLEWPVAQAPVAVVMIHDGRLTLTHPDGWTTSLEAAGSVRVVDDFGPYLLENAAESGPVEVVLVEVR